jgi:glycosyltransferase involved in cell wall biosynthesis
MRVGLSISSLINYKNEVRHYDGLGSYTCNLADALASKVDLKRIYLKSLTETLLHPFSRQIPHSNITCSINPIIDHFSPMTTYQGLAHSIDIFHSTDYLIPAIPNIPVVATLHDAIMLLGNNFANIKFRQLKNYILKKLIHRVDHVITISLSAKAEVIYYWGIPEEKISVAYNGINPNWLIPHANKDNIIKNKYGINKPYLLAVGTISPKKNYLKIMQAYLQLPIEIRQNLTLVIVGKQGWCCEQEMCLLSNLIEQGYAKWLAYVPLLDLQALYQGSQCLVFPSLAEGFGLPIIEGFASNTPVITSDFGATREIAENAAYLVDPNKVESIATAMLELTTDAELRKNLISWGQKRVKAFSWQAHAEHALKIYQQLI